jgi:hypothetical protein
MYLMTAQYIGYCQGAVFSGVFRAKKVDGVGHKGSEVTTMVDVQTYLEDFKNISLRAACFHL